MSDDSDLLKIIRKADKEFKIRKDQHKPLKEVFIGLLELVEKSRLLNQRMLCAISKLEGEEGGLYLAFKEMMHEPGIVFSSRMNSDILEIFEFIAPYMDRIERDRYAGVLAREKSKFNWLIDEICRQKEMMDSESLKFEESNISNSQDLSNIEDRKISVDKGQIEKMNDIASLVGELCGEEWATCEVALDVALDFSDGARKIGLLDGLIKRSYS